MSYDTLAWCVELLLVHSYKRYLTATTTCSWTYLGSESDNTIQFIAPGVLPAAGFPENNANNQCSLASCGTNASGVTGQTGTVEHGNSRRPNGCHSCVYFLDLSDLSSAVNGTNPLDNVGQPNFLMSYAVHLAAGDPGATFGAGLYLTASVYGHCRHRL